MKTVSGVDWLVDLVLGPPRTWGCSLGVRVASWVGWSVVGVPVIVVGGSLGAGVVTETEGTISGVSQSPASICSMAAF